MPKNPLFNQTTEFMEQELVADLVQEAHEIFGEDVVYVCRELQNFDTLYDADDQSLYRDTFVIEVYVKSVRGFGGNKDFLNQFGAQIQDEVDFSMTKRSFDEIIGSKKNFIRPREGDLIFLPVTKRVFTITFVEPREMFYQLGKTYTYSITAELFKYSGEKFDTGIKEIDSLAQDSTNVVDWALRDADGTPLLDVDGSFLLVDKYDLSEIKESEADNQFFVDQFKSYADFSETDPFAEGQF